MNNNIDWKKYLIVFLITMGLFFTASYVSNYFGDKKINQLQNIQDQIAIDILSSETQFSLLSELSCKNISDSVFSRELGELGSKLEWSENNLGSDAEVSYLKKYYSLLQIKDYLLAKRISERCGIKSAFILYFYTTAENCTLCREESLVLSKLRSEYPELRVYSFDYSTDLSAVKAMIQIYKIKDTALPALVIDGDALNGFHGFDELSALVEKSFKLQGIQEPESAE
ncbi:MAG: thioredoxin family protein [Minisyncoccia bacterium]